jgi:hypothetical protein
MIIAIASNVTIEEFLSSDVLAMVKDSRNEPTRCDGIPLDRRV